MSLISPGVQVSVIEESQYLSAPDSSVPLVVIATAENKAIPGGTQVAIGTLAENANEVFLVTSQRELVNLFGTPFFYRTSAGTPINGYELNEYGLMAAYSVLGVSSRAFVIRADVNLADLAARVTRPTGAPLNNSYWLDTANTSWGIFEWYGQQSWYTFLATESSSSLTTESNDFIVTDRTFGTPGTFSAIQPIVITSAADTDAGVPLSSIGIPGNYAVVTTNASNPVYYKNYENAWVLVGSDEWIASNPVVRATIVNPVLTSGSVISINGTSVTLTGTTVAELVTAVNSAAITGVIAKATNGRFELYANSNALDGAVDIFDEDSGALLDELGIDSDIYYIPQLQQSPHTVIPRWKSSDDIPRPTGSIWNKTTAVNQGTQFSLKKWNATERRYMDVTVGVYRDDAEANRTIDPAGGGLSIPTGSVYAQFDALENSTMTFKLYERILAGETRVSGLNINPTFNVGDKFTMSVSNRTSAMMSTPIEVTLSGTSAFEFVTSFNGAGFNNVKAEVNSIGGIDIIHLQGGTIQLIDTLGTPIADAGFIVGVTGVRAGVAPNEVIVTNWDVLNYSASPFAPGFEPLDGAYWYYTAIGEADIMINDGNEWKGYRTVLNDIRGFNLLTTDPAGPIFAASAPTTQSDGTQLVYGDLWIDTSDLENYPVIRRWEIANGEPAWVLLDNSDQTTENGVLFADARWGNNGNIDPINDAIPPITSLLASNYLDLDAPNPLLYPAGTLLFNTRRSSFNVKTYRKNWFNPDVFEGELPAQRNTWVSTVGLRNDGSPYMGRQAVRQIVVSSMRRALDSNTDIREEQRQFNLMAAPGYPELIPTMVSLNNERRNTAFIVGDSPMRLSDNPTDITAWATGTGSDDLRSADPYAGVFYPVCKTFDLDGNEIVQPASHMMLRTLIRSDTVSYPWMAPAGTRRGIIDNAQTIGYVEADTGEFREVLNRESIRNVLYQYRINPITFVPGGGLLNFGNKTLVYSSDDTTNNAATLSAMGLDRINVARLVIYIRARLEAIAKQFLFEPNDQLTRNEFKGQVEQFMNDLTAKRAIYDYLVVCDSSNNTPFRIDRNELWLDLSIEPTKVAEFIYIPVRLKNTGEISGTV